jgi:hypothetical protein
VTRHSGARQRGQKAGGGARLGTSPLFTGRIGTQSRSGSVH